VTAVPGTVPALGTRRRTAGSVIRLGLVPLWTGLCYFAWFVAGIGPGGKARRHRVVRGWAGTLLRILRIRVSFSGKPPRPPFLLVSNHLSYLDVIVLASLVDTRFVAKREVRRWPLFGSAANAIGCIFVDRDTPRDAIRAGQAMQEAYEAGNGIVLFGEGTSSEGATVLEFRPALLEWPARDGRPVHTVALSYHQGPGDPPASHSLCWWGEMTFMPHLAGVCRLGPSMARVVFGAAPVTASDRRALSETARAAVLADFTPSGSAECAL